MCRPKSITTRLQFNLLPFFRVRDSFQKSKRPKVMAIFVQRKLLVLIIGLNGLNWVSELYVEIIQIMWSCVEFMPLRLQHFSKVKVSKTRRFSSSTCLKISRGRKCRPKTRITFFFFALNCNTMMLHIRKRHCNHNVYAKSTAFNSQF